MYYENLELLREKNPLLAFSLGSEVLTGVALAQEYPLWKEAEVYFIYDVVDPTQFFPLVEKGLDVCFIFTTSKTISAFLQNEAARPLLKDPKATFYLLGDGEEIYKQIGWRYLFMKREHLVAYGGPHEIQARLENMVVSIELVASDYREFGVDVLRNVYSNLDASDRVIFGEELRKHFPKRPVMVCGAGPSLRDQLDELKRLYDQVLILGCGSAIPILMKAGIRPHMVAFIDPDPPIASFEELENFDMPLLYQGRMSKDIFKIHKGPKIWMGSSEGYLIEKWLDNELGFPDHFFDAGWNVANFGIRAMAELGASSIYFLGVDSCYEKEVMEPHEWSVQDIHGRPRVTRKDLFMGAKWISSFATDHPDIPIVNVGGEGLSIDSVSTAALSSIHLPVWNPNETMATLLRQTKTHRVDHVRCVELLERIETSLVRAKEIVDECLNRLQTESHKGVFALFDVEIKDELAHNLLLQPLWNVWQHMLLRDSNVDSKLQEILFFHRVLERHL